VASQLTLAGDWKGSDAESAQWNCLLKRQSDYSARMKEASALHRKMTDLVQDSQRLRAAMLRRESEQGTEQTRKERDQLRDDVRKEKELHHVTMFEVEALRRQLDEEKKLHEETRLARDQFSEQNNRQKELCEELRKENKALLEEISKGRDSSRFFLLCLPLFHLALHIFTNIFSLLQKLCAELLDLALYLFTELLDLALYLFTELLDLALHLFADLLLEQQPRGMRNSEQTTARD
jgi:hypothetical protein